MTDKHFACVNTAICNKYGPEPNELCAENECRFVVEKDLEIAPLSLKGIKKDENKKRDRRKI